jgi:predicted dehydrogenase
MNSKIRVAVIGAGKIGSHHARILSALSDAELVGVCDTNYWRAQMVAWRSGTTAYRDYRDLLNRVDAVVVAVPTQLHFEVGRMALEAGLHCLIEKPITTTIEESRILLNVAQAKDLVLQVGHVERFNPAVIEAIRHIRTPRFITCERLGPYDPRVSAIGVVMDLMIHDLDILLTLVGSEVNSLEAIGASLLSPHEDIANVRLRFDSGCIADVTASRISLSKSRKIRIFQEDSYLSLDYANASLKICRKKTPIITSIADIDIVHPKLIKKEPLRIQLEHFLSCIRHRHQPLVTGEHGMEALRLALRITEELHNYELHHRGEIKEDSWKGGWISLEGISKALFGGRS